MIILGDISMLVTCCYPAASYTKSILLELFDDRNSQQNTLTDSIYKFLFVSVSSDAVYEFQKMTLMK